MHRVRKALVMILILGGCLLAGPLTGLSIGLTTNRFSGQLSSGKTIALLPGFQLGGTFRWPLNSGFEILNSIELQSRGARINTLGDIYLTNLFIYLQAPVMLACRPIPKAHCVNLLAGVSPGLRLLAYNDVGFMEDIRALDMAMIFGVSLARDRVDLTARCQQSLTPFDSGDSADPLRHRTVEMLVNFHLR